MAIKNEVEGPSGYLHKIREHYLPSSREMADLALERYQKSIGQILTKEYVLDNTDSVLKGLFVAETQIFSERNSQILSSAIPFFFKELYKRNDGNYPETSSNMARLETLFEKCRDGNVQIDYFISEIAESVGPVMDVISFSQKQAAKSRVGNSLQNHLQTIFEKCEIPSSSQQQREDGGTIMDFIIPNLEACSFMPDQVMNIECQTTLKDRFRLTTGKSTDARIKRYLATATGCGLVTARDVHDFTIEKVKEIIINNNVTLVVFAEVKEKLVSMIQSTLDQESSNNPSSATVSELTRLLNRSYNMIGSYKELVNRDIQTILTYWAGVL